MQWLPKKKKPTTDHKICVKAQCVSVLKKTTLNNVTYMFMLNNRGSHMVFRFYFNIN